MKTIKSMIELGTREFELTISKANPWTSADGSRSRIYYEVESPSYNPVDKFYRVVEGGTRDNHFEINGVVFGFSFSGAANSHRKQSATFDTLKDMATQILAAEEDEEIFDEDQIILLPAEA